MPPRKADPERFCAECGGPLVRARYEGRLEDRTLFLKRRFCRPECAWTARRRNSRAPTLSETVGPRPRLLDLFCGAGGAAVGYHRAGFEVVGVDAAPQPNYPFEFHQADAMRFPLDGFDAIHASPPCQRYSKATRGHWSKHPDLLPGTVARLKRTDVPWVVENVPGAPIAPDFVLCGSMFNLPVQRHRWFVTSWHGFELMAMCRHSNQQQFDHRKERAYADAMGCDWMSNREAREAIPPAFTEWLGERLLAVVGAKT